jgi:4-carboxymuconolactone decarboxylase
MTLERTDDVSPYQSILAEHDPEILHAIEVLPEIVYKGRRTLDAKLKELLAVVILTSVKASEDSIKRHVRRALAAGASSTEVLEALELIIAPAGLPAFEHGLIAWANATGAKGLDPEQTPSYTRLP